VAYHAYVMGRAYPQFSITPYLTLLDKKEFVGISTHCDNFERDALNRCWQLIHVLVPVK
jgi:hypothetical protein